MAFSLLSVQCNWNFSSGHVASVTREQNNLYLFTCFGVNRGIKKDQLSTNGEDEAVGDG